MSNSIVPFIEVEKMAQAVAKSGLFGAKTAEQALSLMLIAQAEGMHPAQACMEFDIIQGRPARKSVAMLGKFQQAGGIVNWFKNEDTEVSAEFSHPQSPTPLLISWTMERAKRAGLTGKDNWIKYPRQMLRARVIAEGVRATYPSAVSGIYSVEELQDEPVNANGNGNAHPKAINTVDGLKEALKAKSVDAVVSEPVAPVVVEKASEPVKDVRKSVEEEANDFLADANIDIGEWDVAEKGMKKVKNPDQSLKDVAVGETLAECQFVFLDTKYNEKIGKTGKTTLKVQDDNGSVYWIDRWGKLKNEFPSESVVTILCIKVGEFKGKRQYMCEKVLLA
jgi:hypothetical protein